MRRCIIGFALFLVLGDTAAIADTFGLGANQFTIDFVPISGRTNPANGIPIDMHFTFTGVTNNYRVGIHEITNDQWNKFQASLGVPVTGNPWSAYHDSSYSTGASVPTDNVSWYEAAQFVNWLNTSTGNQAAYKFTGTQGTSNYLFATWSPAEAAGGTNLYRHKDAVYFLPTEDEWVKAAYWNGTTLQDYATKAGETLTQGDGISGTGWNYYTDQTGHATDPLGPWNVGTGSKELNGTYDMMGNVYEWLESPGVSGDYLPTSRRGSRGGGWDYHALNMAAGSRSRDDPTIEDGLKGFRVASAIVPEPGSITLMVAGVLGFLIWSLPRHGGLTHREPTAG